MASNRGDRRQQGNRNSTTDPKDFANKLPAFDKGLLKHCSFYHFYNFPDDWGARQLFYFIGKSMKAGRLWDIFILRTKKVIELKGTKKDEENLMKCAVGAVLSPDMIPNLPVVFFNEGFPSIKIVPMGGNLVLIDDENPEQIKELVGGNLEWVLPMHAWSEESLALIGNHMGTLVSIDEHTLSKEWLNTARILISTKSKSTIKEELILKIKNNQFHIVPTDENWRNDPQWLKKASRSIGDSDESSSDYSFGDVAGEMDCSSSDSSEEKEIQTSFGVVKGINCSDKLGVPKFFAQVCKEVKGALSSQERGEQSIRHDDKWASESHISLTNSSKIVEQVVQETTQFIIPITRQTKAHLPTVKRGVGCQEETGLQVTEGPNKNPIIIPGKEKVEVMKLVTGMKRGRRKKALLQSANYGGESSKGSLSDSYILSNNKRIKEPMILEESKKAFEFGEKLGIDTRNGKE
ncbi:hypothetical protein SLEP1_g7288 [Rubroshorea leprosula]|uniref:DUF4283 domain-containing protein n=1 Tax=Rubroshorea leprosula TaxID=152421 RepID=A0AAV5I3Q0_9ROSI|nr:hypothetical protein SLEP1_g7288 [Rubroshorea leprosula]